MIYIAATNPEAPWNLTSEPVLLTRPLFGWENHRGTINNEGPNAFIAGDTVYLTYSGGASGGYSYVIGMLTAKTGSDLLDPKSWVKNNAPVFSYTAEVSGAGHNSFYADEDGNLMITFHAEESYVIDGVPPLHRYPPGAFRYRGDASLRHDPRAGSEPRPRRCGNDGALVSKRN